MSWFRTKPQSFMTWVTGQVTTSRKLKSLRPLISLRQDTCAWARSVHERVAMSILNAQIHFIVRFSIYFSISLDNVKSIWHFLKSHCETQSTIIAILISQHMGHATISFSLTAEIPRYTTVMFCYGCQKWTGSSLLKGVCGIRLIWNKKLVFPQALLDHGFKYA